LKHDVEGFTNQDSGIAVAVSTSSVFSRKPTAGFPKARRLVVGQKRRPLAKDRRNVVIMASPQKKLKISKVRVQKRYRCMRIKKCLHAHTHSISLSSLGFVIGAVIGAVHRKVQAYGLWSGT